MYSEKTLVRVIPKDKYGNCLPDVYYAVDTKTAENMEDTSSSMQYSICKSSEEYNSLQFDVIDLGMIYVQHE